MKKTVYIRLPDDVLAAVEADKRKRETRGGAPLTISAHLVALLRLALGPSRGKK